MDATSFRSRPRRGFTLVELLVVIVIIGILAGLITGVAWQVRKRAKVMAVVSEIAQIEQALEAYKLKFGEYPPDFSEPAGQQRIQAVERHVRRAFPRYRTNNSIAADLSSVGLDINKMDPGAALVCWLGGISRNNTSVKLTGFSADVRYPFTRANARIKPFFDFDPERLNRGSDGVLRYYPPGVGSPAASAPYVYFRARRGGYVHINTAWWKTPFASGPVVPCKLVLDNGEVDWPNPQTYQIICGGMDGKIGTGVRFPVGDDYDADNNYEYRFDDITNFAKGTLEDKMP